MERIGLLQKAVKYVCESDYRFLVNAAHGKYNRLSDEEYLKRKYEAVFHKTLNLDNPQTFNEKLQWLKLYDRRPEYTVMVDKYAVKDYVAGMIGEEYIIPLLGVWDQFDDIPFDKLPDQFVLKCTHDCGGIIICRNKKEFRRAEAKKKLERCMKRNYYWYSREWPYKDVTPRIIAEKFMEEEPGADLKDYKIFNFDGKPRLIQVDFDRFTDHKRNLYTTDWQYLEAAIQFPTDPQKKIRKPERLQEMLKLAGRLSRGIAHVRTDFYIIHDRIYFGELTFYHGSGLEHFTPDLLGKYMGEMIKLPSGKVRSFS